MIPDPSRSRARARSRYVEEPVDLTTGVPASGPARAARSSRARIGRALGGLVVVLAVLAAAYFAPLPSIGWIRSWSETLGPWFVIVYFAGCAVLMTAPLPRTPLTITAGVLFGPAVGFTGAMIAAALAAAAGFALARRLGRARVQRYTDRAAFATIERRLQRRGWLAVGSLRLIPVIPFSLVNYASGLSSLRPVPYLIASVIGSMPGTAAVVFLGDALTGDADPRMIVASGLLFALGVLGLIVDLRLPVSGGSSIDT